MRLFYCSFLFLLVTSHLCAEPSDGQPEASLLSCIEVNEAKTLLAECSAGDNILPIIQQSKESPNHFASGFFDGAYHAVYSGEADNVSFCCEMQKKMHYNAVQKVWTISFAGTEITKLHFQQMVDVDGVFKRLGVWSGREAILLPEKHNAGVTKHIVRTDDWARTISVFIPPKLNGNVVNIVYLADGVGLSGYVSRTAEADYSNTIYVGLFTGYSEQASKVKYGRNKEYLFNPKKNNDGFVAHNKFFMDSIIPYVEHELLGDYIISKRYLMGNSSGGAWAASTAIMNPHLFSGAYVNSPVYRPLLKYIRQHKPDQAQKFYLMYGSIEPHASKLVSKIYCALRAYGNKTEIFTVPGGHSSFTWTKAFLSVAQPELGKNYKTEIIPDCE